jgi:hypothetical protein
LPPINILTCAFPGINLDPSGALNVWINRIIDIVNNRAFQVKSLDLSLK